MRLRTALFFTLSVFPILLFSQNNQPRDIPVENLPSEVRQVLVRYLEILTTSSSLEDCAAKFRDIAGGSLVNEDGSLRSTVPQFALKKDFNDVKVYAVPPVITRVNTARTNRDGYGSTALRGMVYKIWIQKKDVSQGMPAPIAIIVPEGHPSITTPKVIGIGNL